jgi:hypothetical protein
VRDKNAHRKRLLALLLFAPVIAGCSGASDMFSSDLLSKDAEWFSRSGRLFIKNVSIETPPLTPNKAVTADDLVSAEGYCAGMAPPGGSNALAEGATASQPPGGSNALAEGATASPPPSTTGTVALGHTECDVVRGIGSPGSVNLSNNGRGDRVAVITYLQGQRAGIYTFTGGRLTSIERAPGAVVQPKPARSRKKPAAT